MEGPRSCGHARVWGGGGGQADSFLWHHASAPPRARALRGGRGGLPGSPQAVRRAGGGLEACCRPHLGGKHSNPFWSERGRDSRMPRRLGVATVTYRDGHVSRRSRVAAVTCRDT
eukprot:3575312-Prymnesium_polylepis.1